MATTGDPLYPSATTYPSSTTYPGQGLAPMAWILYSTDDASDTDPLWLDATAKVRSFFTSRGRDSELSEIDAGIATLTLDNRTRSFDPVADPAIRPMNRWKVLSQFSGETQPIYVGYAESYDQTWPDGMDAEAVVQCADEFKVLALDRLPVSNPPRDTYEDLVMFDDPSGYWRMDDQKETLLPGWWRTRTKRLPADVVFGLHGKVGKTLTPTAGSITTSTSTAIVGDRGTSVTFAANSAVFADGMSNDDPGDMGGCAEMTAEVWVRLVSGLPGATETLMLGPGTTPPTSQYALQLTSAGGLSFLVRGTAGTVTSTGGALTADPNRWRHIVCTIDGGSLRIYLDGVQVGSTAWADTILALIPRFQLGDGGNGQSYGFDEVAVYRHGFDSARVDAHYTAGTARGFIEQNSGTRVGAILDTVTSHAPRNIRTGVRSVLPAFMHGQAPLEEIRTAVRGEAVDGVLFIAKDGTVTFLDAGHRSVSPWDTVQATFDDDGTDLPYPVLDVDYSEAFLVNEWNVTKDGGLLQTASDPTSIARYFKRSQSLTGLPVLTDTDALNVATVLLAKYKDPLNRIKSLDITTDVAAVTEAVFRLDIGSRIRIFRTPPGGGARIDQTAWVQKISVQGANDGKPWQITLGVSPL